MARKNSGVSKPVESKQDALKRIASKRMPKVLRAIRTVGNLASYKPTEQQITFIMHALKSAIKDTEDRLQGASPVSEFEL